MSDARPPARVLHHDVDPGACAWLRELCRQGAIAGEVLEGDVRDLRAADLAGVRRFHAFAGIGGWERALDLAGWPDERSEFLGGVGGTAPDVGEVWTGSCPCQPFSQAGRRKGTADERHLWPAWHALIRERRPAVVLGEQVSSPDGLAWLDLVLADLEGEGYSVGAADLCAAGVGAPHLRQRLYFVGVLFDERVDRAVLRGLADADGDGREGAGPDVPERGPVAGLPDALRNGALGPLADDSSQRRGPRRERGAVRGRAVAGGPPREPPGRGDARGLADDPGGRREEGLAPRGRAAGSDGPRPINGGELGDAGRARGGRDGGRLPRAQEESDCGGGEPRSELDELLAAGLPLRVGGDLAGRLGVVSGFWAPADLLYHRDGRYRPVEPGSRPLAHGVPGRVGLLRGYGNAIVPQVAATFVRAVMGSLGIAPRR